MPRFRTCRSKERDLKRDDALPSFRTLLQFVEIVDETKGGLVTTFDHVLLLRVPYARCGDRFFFAGLFVARSPFGGFVFLCALCGFSSRPLRLRAFLSDFREALSVLYG